MTESEKGPILKLVRQVLINDRDAAINELREEGLFDKVLNDALDEFRLEHDPDKSKKFRHMLCNALRGANMQHLTYYQASSLYDELTKQKG